MDKDKKDDNSWFSGGWGCLLIVLLIELPKIWFWVGSDRSSDYVSMVNKMSLVTGTIISCLACFGLSYYSFSVRRYWLQPIISLLAIIAVALWTNLLGPVEFNWTWYCIIPLVFFALVSFGILIVRALYIRLNPQNIVLKALIQIVPMLIWGAAVVALHYFFA